MCSNRRVLLKALLLFVVAVLVVCPRAQADDPIADCNENGLNDADEIAQGLVPDCNDNGTPDECELCPLDVVFIMDTSPSMADGSQPEEDWELPVLCARIPSVVQALQDLHIEVAAAVHGIRDRIWTDGCDDSPYSLLNLLGSTVPGDPGACGTHLNPGPAGNENWGQATALAAQEWPWTPGAVRVIVPMSDEGPCLGDPCVEPPDHDAAENAIAVAKANNVHVCPIAGRNDWLSGYEIACVEGYAERIASETGGRAVLMREVLNENLEEEMVFAIESALRAACGDCNLNGIPDECETDCNQNGIPDDCDITSGFSQDCEPNGVPDECEFEPGDLFVVMRDEPPRPFPVAFSCGTPFKVSYDPARLGVWDTATKDNLIPPDVVFAAGTADLDGDAEPDCDVDFKDFRDLQRCFTGTGGGPIGSGCEPFDLEPDDDVDLPDFALQYAEMTGPLAVTVPNTLYIEGLTTSTALSDTFLMVLADPDRDGQFQIEANRQVTVASISFSPYVLGPGDLLTITLEPAIPPLAFDELTAAEWQGSYTPPNSPPTPPFTVSYSAEHFRESSPGVAVLVAGDGSMTDAPSFEELNEGGVVWGSFMFHLAGCLLLHRTPPSPFSLNDAEFLWYKIHYPYEGYGYLDEPPTLEPIPLEELPTRWWPPVVYPEFLDTNYYYHTACVLMVDENPETIAGAPDSLLVDVVTYWPIGFEVDRVENVVLSRVPDDDGHPNHLVYRSDLSRPIVFFQQEVPKEYFPDFTILYAVEDGPVVVVSKGMEAP